MFAKAAEFGVVGVRGRQVADLSKEALQRWTRCFPPEQLLILQYESCVANPIRELVTTYEFLGLDPSYRPEDLRDEVNKTVERKAGLPDDALHRLREIFAPDIISLADMVPTLDLTLWPSADGLLA